MLIMYPTAFLDKLKYPLGIMLLIFVNNFAIADPSQSHPSQKSSQVILNAFSIHHDQLGRATYLIGNVDVNFPNNMELKADRMLVKYNARFPSKISQCIIYGHGLLITAGHITEFKDGVFDAHKMRLSANAIHPLEINKS